MPIVVVTRLVWLAYHPAPEPPSDPPTWQRIGAHLLQILLYGLLIALPVLGWLWASALGWAIRLFGLVTLPDLVGHGAAICRVAGDLHALLSNGLLALVGIQVVGAPYHAVFRCDGVMQRMLPASHRST